MFASVGAGDCNFSFSCWTVCLSRLLWRSVVCYSKCATRLCTLLGSVSVWWVSVAWCGQTLTMDAAWQVVSSINMQLFTAISCALACRYFYSIQFMHFEGLPCTNHQVTKLTFSWSQYVSFFFGMIQQAVVKLKHSLWRQYIVTHFGYILIYKFEVCPWILL